MTEEVKESVEETCVVLIPQDDIRKGDLNAKLCVSKFKVTIKDFNITNISALEDKETREVKLEDPHGFVDVDPTKINHKYGINLAPKWNTLEHVMNSSSNEIPMQYLFTRCCDKCSTLVSHKKYVYQLNGKNKLNMKTIQKNELTNLHCLNLDVTICSDCWNTYSEEQKSDITKDFSNDTITYKQSITLEDQKQFIMQSLTPLLDHEKLLDKLANSIDTVNNKFNEYENLWKDGFLSEAHMIKHNDYSEYANKFANKVNDFMNEVELKSYELVDQMKAYIIIINAINNKLEKMINCCSSDEVEYEEKDIIQDLNELSELIN
jgi:hypothetical protein